MSEVNRGTQGHAATERPPREVVTATKDRRFIDVSNPLVLESTTNRRSGLAEWLRAQKRKLQIAVAAGTTVVAAACAANVAGTPQALYAPPETSTTGPSTQETHSPDPNKMREIMCRAVSDAEIAKLLGNAPLEDIQRCEVDTSLSSGPSDPVIVTSGRWEQKSTQTSVSMWVIEDPAQPNTAEPGNFNNAIFAQYHDEAGAKAQILNTYIFQGDDGVRYDSWIAYFENKDPNIGSVSQKVVGAITTADNYSMWMTVTGQPDVKLPLKSMDDVGLSLKNSMTVAFPAVAAG